MKWFLITLAIGLAVSDKLDRTYLPPPGAHLAGGILGSHDAPLQPPHHLHSGQVPVIPEQESQRNFGVNGEPVNFGDKIPKVPVTTTSYAFSQTTTYPPGEGFETTPLPINPVTGLPIQLDQGLQNFPYGPQGQQNVQNLPGYSQTLTPTYETNIQPGPKNPTSAPINVGSTGYPGQNQGELQYPGGQSNTPSQGFIPTGAFDNQRMDQHPGQDLVNAGDVIQFPGGNQDLVQYPAGQTITGQQGFTPTTGSQINLQPGGNQNGVNYDGTQGSIPQGTYSGQAINVPNLGGPQPSQTSFQNREPINIGRPQSQYPSGNQNYGTPAPTGSENPYQPGSVSSTFPSTYNNGIPSTTAHPGVPSSTTSYSSVGPVYRPERLQAAADRDAVILNYENIRTPNGYSYSFDTSNGIHADENGIVDNGTKAQGAYSYIGDDGKVYSVIYTADENGFQPRGDHLPTPPPVPEAIQRLIEQAAKDKAAGIVHDGSYDEDKYGDHNYQENASHRRLQNQQANQFDKDHFNRTQDGLIKPIAGLKDEKYDDDEESSKDQFNNNLPITDTNKGSNGKLLTTRPANQNGGKNSQDISEGNRRISGDFYSPRGDFDGNRMPIVEDEINQPNHFGSTKQKPAVQRPGSSGNIFSTTRGNDFNNNNLSGSKNGRPSESRPISDDAEDVSEKYPGSNVNVGATDESGNAGEDIYEGQNIDFGNPTAADGPGENINTNYDSVTGAPINENKKQKLRQRIKGNRRPISADNRNTQKNSDRYQGETFAQDYYKKGNAHQPSTQEGDTGYNYQQPNTKFEQNTFPTRFNPQEAPSTTPDQRGNEYVEGTTRKPFMTPNVYHQNGRNNQTTLSVYNKNDRNSQTTTRRPYTTPFNTDDSYTDYDDGEYATDQDISDDRIQSTNKPADKRITSRPYQSTQNTSRPQTVPGGQRTDVNKKGAVSPGRRMEYTGTESSGYTYGPTTQMPSHYSRFGSTEIPRRMRPQERRPSTTVPDSTTAVGRLVTTQSPLATGQPNYRYQNTEPFSKYSSGNVGSGYPTTGFFPGTGSMSTTPGVSTPQDYYTTTYRPSQGYYSTTAVPPTSGYIQGSSSQIPSSAPESYQPTQDGTFHTGYHYGPPMSGSVNLDGPGFSTPTGTSAVFPTSPSGTYQTTYQQGFPSTTFVPATSGKQGSLIPSQPGTFTPGTFPTGSYQGNYQNGPSTQNYGTTIDSSTPGKPVFVYPGQTGATDTTGFEYGPRYSTTDSPSTVGTTPGSFIPTGTTGLSQDYSTTYRPGVQSTQDTFVGRTVDGFGRPVIIGQGGLHPGFVYPTQGPSGSVTNVGPNFGSTDQSNIYPGSYDQTRVIGEDFSGPKQPQRFDPKTGYHYK